MNPGGSNATCILSFPEDKQQEIIKLIGDWLEI